MTKSIEGKKVIQLVRIAENQDGTFGVLLDNRTPFALTAERRWINNEKNISCIPTGMYQCRRKWSFKYGQTFQLLDVPQRSYILFHKGNIPDKDSKGCILVGESFDPMLGSTAVLSSAKGFSEFMWILRHFDKFILIIRDYWKDLMSKDEDKIRRYL